MRSGVDEKLRFTDKKGKNEEVVTEV